MNRIQPALLPENHAKSGWRQLLLYFFFGGIAALADYFLYWLAVSRAGMHYLPAGAVSFSAAVIINYWVSVKWVFQRGRYSKGMEICLVFLVSLAGLILSGICLILFIDLIKVHYMAAKVLANGVVFFWNFYARKKLIFAG